MRESLAAVARGLARWTVDAHGYYFLSALAALTAAGAAFEGPVRLVPVAVVWWIAGVHEFGHALGAVAFRMNVSSCFAIPGFGRTRVRHGGRALQWGVVALLGPLAGMVASLLVAVFASSAAFGPALGEAGRSWLLVLAWLGALESGFNLLPVHRLLDGRVALVSFRRTYDAWAESRARRRWRMEAGFPVPSQETAAAAARTRKLPPRIAPVAPPAVRVLAPPAIPPRTACVRRREPLRLAA